MRLPDESELLSREDFKLHVFARSGGRCVFCSEPAVDPHHVLERKLYPDGGYYLGNGAAVCDAHHWKCETTELTVEQVRAAAGIQSPVLPPGFAAGEVYDKWGNLMRPDGFRQVGPLAGEHGMLKALKYGRLLHTLLPA